MAREYIDELGDGTINPETSGVDSQATDNGTHVKTLAPIYYTPATIANDGKATRETPVTIKSALEGKSNKNDGVYYVVGTYDYSAYSSTATYTATTSSGPFTSANSCVYSGKAYFCKTTISTPEAWNSGHWTAIPTPVLTGTIDGVTELYAGLKIAYKFSITGGSSSTYLNINNLGNKYIRRNDGNLTTHIPYNSAAFLVFDGTYWRWADYYADNVYSIHAACGTTASTAAKAATAYGYVLTAGETFLIRFSSANTYAGKLTLNVNSQGAKDIWINGAVSSSSNYNIPAGIWWCHYDGTVYHIWTDGSVMFKELRLTTKLADDYIASAETWNAKLSQLYQAEYGVSTFADIYAAITAKKTVYCKVPGAGANTSRMAFLAYISVSNPPTSSSFIEFQYYRSDSSGTGDSVFVYTITNNNNTWTTVERAASSSVKGNAESTYRTGQVNLTPANLGISATTSSVTVGSTTFNKYTHPTQTAFSAKGSATKVPQITTDSTGHVTNIDEVDINYPYYNSTDLIVHNENNSTPYLLYEISGMGLTGTSKSATTEMMIYPARSRAASVDSSIANHMSFKACIHWQETMAKVNVETSIPFGTVTAVVVNSATPTSGTDVSTLKIYLTPSNYVSYRVSIIDNRLRSQNGLMQGTIVKKGIREAIPAASDLVIVGTTNVMTMQTKENLITSWNSTPSDTVYPSEKLVKTSINTLDGNVVHKSGDEVISDSKTFDGSWNFRGAWDTNAYQKGFGVFMLGTNATGGNYADWTEAQKDGNHHREWTLAFPSISNINDAPFQIRVTLFGGYNLRNTCNVMSKRINAYLKIASPYKVVQQYGFYDQLGGSIEDEFRISEIMWDATNTRYCIKVRNVMPEKNNIVVFVVVEYLAGLNSVRNWLKGISWASTTPEIVEGGSYFSRRTGNVTDEETTANGRFINWADKPVLQGTYGDEIQYNWVGTSSTGGSDAGKTATIPGFQLRANSKAIVYFTYANTANNPTLNISSTGAKNIFANGSRITTGANKSVLSGAVLVVFDGTQYHVVGSSALARESTSGVVTLDNSTPLTIGTASTDGVATGKGHFHDGIASVERASVTNIDLPNGGINRARLTLSQVTSQTTEGIDPGDGYVLNLLWDNTGNWDTQIYVPNAKKADKDFGHLKVRYKNESSTWGEWEYLPGAFMGAQLSSTNDLDTISSPQNGVSGEVIQYYWKSTSKPKSTSSIGQPGMDGTTGLPSGTGSANLFVFEQSNNRTDARYLIQMMLCADIGIWVRRNFGGTWSTWTRIANTDDIADIDGRKADLENTSQAVLAEPSQTDGTKYLIVSQTTIGGSSTSAYLNYDLSMMIQSRHSGTGLAVIQCNINGTPTETGLTGTINIFTTTSTIRINSPLLMYRKYDASTYKWTITVVVKCNDYNNFRIKSILSKNGLNYSTSCSYVTDLTTLGTQIASAVTASNSDHTHGNITNGGALQTDDITIASGDKLVVTDANNSHKIARTSVSFDGSTTTKALTQKGTFESFAKSGDITTAIQALVAPSVGGAGKYISAISETDGKISATATTMDTTPTASSTNAVTSGGIKTALDGKAPNYHASSSDTYGLATGSLYGHVKIVSGDMNGGVSVFGEAVGKNHTHSQYSETSHGHGNITSGGTITSDTTVASGDKLVIIDADNNKVARSGLAFNGSTTSKFLTQKGTFGSVLYADESWGGAFRTSLAPFDNYAFKQANVFFGIEPSAVKVEYSTDGGSSWFDYGLTDEQKVNIFNQFAGQSVYCGQHRHVHSGYTGSLTYDAKDLTNSNIANQRLRITICDSSLSNEGTTNSNGRWLYCNLRRIGIYMSTQSASDGTHCLVEKRTSANFKAGTNTWETVGDYKIQGDSGWNSIPCGNDNAGGGITFGLSNSHYRQIRLTIWSDQLKASPNATQTGDLLISKIMAYSELVWYQRGASVSSSNPTAVPNPNMAYYGTPYTVNAVTGVASFYKPIPVGSGGTNATTVYAAQNSLLGTMNPSTTAINENTRFAFAYVYPNNTEGAVYYRTASYVWDWIKGNLSNDTSLSINASAIINSIDITGLQKRVSTIVFQDMLNVGKHYARWICKTAAGSASITERPVTTQGPFAMEAFVQKYVPGSSASSTCKIIYYPDDQSAPWFTEMSFNLTANPMITINAWKHLSDADTVDGYHIVVGTVGNDPNTIYFF